MPGSVRLAVTQSLINLPKSGASVVLLLLYLYQCFVQLIGLWLIADCKELVLNNFRFLLPKSVCGCVVFIVTLSLFARSVTCLERKITFNPPVDSHGS